MVNNRETSVRDLLERLGMTIAEPLSGVSDAALESRPHGSEIIVPSVNPATGETLASVRLATLEDYESTIKVAADRFVLWRQVPAPQRGAVVRRLGELLRLHKSDLGLLVTLESGKILAEGEGEVQEMIDMCDFAVGLSRQLYGLTIASERPNHRLMEQWHPLGIVGIITAFNFPVAVWAWNAALAAVCGNSMVWKPSPLTPLCALAVQSLCNRVMAEFDCPGLFNLCVGEAQPVGERILEDDRLPLISATGSCAMGRRVAEVVGRRLGRSLLELGGNNAAIVAPSADLDLALRAILFGAVGTAGQRCTTLRRLFVHQSIADTLISRLVKAYQSVTIGDPRQPGVLMGPLIRERSVETMQKALIAAQSQGGALLTGGEIVHSKGFFVTPALVQAHQHLAIIGEETFAPILYVMPYRELAEAITWQNQVSQGLASAIFTNDLREAEVFLSALGSDCGIANVNIGTSGAEIGGAFGGEKATGGGREAGSDAWKAYMRRQTCTVNFGQELPLAQGVRFDLPPGPTNA